MRLQVKRAARAFTLLEVLIVVTIILLLCSITIPAFVSWIPKYRLNSAADDLLVLLQNARLRAIKENANVIVDFDPAANGNPDGRFIVFVDSGMDHDGNLNPTLRNNNIQEGREKTILSGRIKPNIHLKEVKFNGSLTYLRFTNRGLGYAGHITIRNRRGDIREIKTTVAGNIHRDVPG
jgi:prepilin-type N-terminal cleavage/methylation domain-containing protein